MTRAPRRALAALAIAVPLLLGACGSDANDVGNGKSTPTKATTAAVETSAPADAATTVAATTTTKKP
jgi:hypothetical protein